MVVGVLCVLGIPGLAYSADRDRDCSDDRNHDCSDERDRTHGTVPKSSASYTSCQEYQNFSFDEFTNNKRFNLNTLCTTPYQNPDTPAWADIIKAPENFVACSDATIALCYYSGPETPAPASLPPCRAIAASIR